MLEAIISGSAANNHSERELWTRSGELQRTGRLEKLALSTSGAEAPIHTKGTTATLEALRHPKTKLSSLRHHRSPAPPKTEFFISLQLQALLGDRSRGPRSPTTVYMRDRNNTLA